jgi:hypothetical protein
MQYSKKTGVILSRVAGSLAVILIVSAIVTVTSRQAMATPKNGATDRLAVHKMPHGTTYVK